VTDFKLYARWMLTFQTLERRRATVASWEERDGKEVADKLREALHEVHGIMSKESDSDKARMARYAELAGLKSLHRDTTK